MDAPPPPRRRRWRLWKWGLIALAAAGWLGWRTVRRWTRPAPAPFVVPIGELKRRLDTAALQTSAMVAAELVPPFRWERLDDDPREVRLAVTGAVRNTDVAPQRIGVMLALAGDDGTVLAMGALDTPAIAPGATAPFRLAPLRIDPGLIGRIERWQLVLRAPPGD